jgi:integrase
MTEPMVRQRRPRRKVLTDTMVAGLERRDAPYFHPDPELVKFGVRVRPSGPGPFTVIVRDIYGKQRWVKIGSTDAMKIEEAREIARDVIKRIERGDTPFPPAPSKPDSVEAVAREWLKRHVAKNKLRTVAEITRVIEKYILPVWKTRDFVSIKRSDIAALLDAIEDQHGAHTADAVLAVLRSLARWVQSRDDNYEPPFTEGMQRVQKRDRKRSRWLNDDEIRAVWGAASAKDAGAFGSLVRFLLLTGQRKDKVLTVRWSDIAPDGTWTIRTEPREKGNPGRLSLSEAAHAIIKAMPRFAGNPHVFAGTDKGHKIFSQSYKRVLDKACGVTGWRLHDLRRTARSLLSKAGARPDVAELCLGHVVGGVKEVYDRYNYAAEMAEALRRLEALIEIILAGGPTDDIPALRKQIDEMVTTPSTW